MRSLFLIPLLALAVAACDQDEAERSCGEADGPWQRVAQIGAATTDSFGCGEEGVMYANTTATAQVVSFDITNDCEFTAWLWTMDANGAIQNIRNIPGYSTLSDNAGVEAGGQLYLICTMVESVEGTGCQTSYTVLGTS